MITFAHDCFQTPPLQLKYITNLKWIDILKNVGNNIDLLLSSITVSVYVCVWGGGGGFNIVDFGE